MTGVLPIALENATKAMPVLTGVDKEYVGVMHLHKEIPEDLVRNVIVEKFIGKIKQPRRPREVASAVLLGVSKLALQLGYKAVPGWR